MENSLKQYLDLYSAHKELISDHSPECMNRLREEAYDSLKINGLPQKGSENYEISDLPKMLAPDYGLNIARIPLDVNVASGFKCGLPHLTPSLFFMLNDLWAESKEARKNLPAGVEIGPLSSVLKRVDEAKEYYGSLADVANPIVGLNTMLAQEGVYVKVGKNVKVEKPLQLVNILDNTMPLMAVRRILIILEEGAELKLLSCDHTSARNIDMASLSVAEIFVGDGAHLDYYEIEESGTHTNRLSSLFAKLGKGSKMVIDSFTLHNGCTRNEFNCVFEGEDSSLKLLGLGIETGESVLDNFSNIRHNIGKCHTEELLKYILEDKSLGAFTGRIFVAPGASKTEAYQSNRNIVSSKESRMFSKPQLEIYNDDVKCSHGSATGQLDEFQLFYMRSRGLDEEVARKLLKQAFVADIIGGIDLPLLHDRLQSLIEKRFAGISLTCSECEACNYENLPK